MTAAENCTNFVSPFITAYSAPVCNSPEEKKVEEIMGQVIDAKERQLQICEATKKWDKSRKVLVCGNVFNVGYLAFTGIQIAKSSLALITAIGIATTIMGVAAGVLSIAEAKVSAQEGWQAWKGDHRILAIRLWITCFGQFSLGLFMIFVSLAVRIAALGALHATLVAYPWLLPTLFFIASVPVIFEVINKIRYIAGSNFIEQLHSQNLREFIHRNLNLQSLFAEKDNQAIFNALSNKMEQLQADMDVNVAIETFKLLRLVLQSQSEIKQQEQLNKVQEKITEWRHAQYLRGVLQILYTIAFVLSMAAIRPQINTTAMQEITTGAMVGSNVIDGFLNAARPYSGDTPIVVPSAGGIVEGPERSISKIP